MNMFLPAACICLLIVPIPSIHACFYGEVSCSNSYSNWCCSSDDICGSISGECLSASSSLPPAIIAVIIAGSIIFCVACLSCCLRSQQQQQQQRLRSTLVANHDYGHVIGCPQSTQRGPIRIVRVQSVYNPGAVRSAHLPPGIYEAPPPTYEAAIANSSPPPLTATVQQPDSPA